MIHLPAVRSTISFEDTLSGRSSENHSLSGQSAWRAEDFSIPCVPDSSTIISSNLQPGCSTRRTAAVSTIALTARV